MKLSRYNIFVDIGNEDKLLYNCLSGVMAKVDGEAYRRLMSIDSDSQKEPVLTDGKPDETVNEFIRNGVIIADDLNEIDILRAKHNLSKHQTKLGITIMPTLGCNFNCSYCSVVGGHNAHEKMSEVTEKQLIEFVHRLLPGYKRVLLMWTGGEPTLVHNTVCRVTAAIRKMAAEMEKDFGATVQTNGYLLDRNKALELKDCGVNQISVSFDGPPEVHDKRRFLRDGRGTFDVVMKNIKDILGLFDIFLLTYVDKNNMESFLKLLDIYEEEGLIGKVTVLCDNIIPYEWIEDGTENSILDEEFAAAIMKLKRVITKPGVVTQQDPYPIWESDCAGIHSNNFIISPEGDIYRCRLLVGDKINSVGNVRDRKWHMNPEYIRWLAFDMLGNPQCRECNILPVCMGGCPINELSLGLKAPAAMNKRICSAFKYNIEEAIKFKYEKTRGNTYEGVKV